MKTFNRQSLWLPLILLLLVLQVFTLAWMWLHPCTTGALVQQEKALASSPAVDQPLPAQTVQAPVVNPSPAPLSGPAPKALVDPAKTTDPGAPKPKIYSAPLAKNNGYADHPYQENQKSPEWNVPVPKRKQKIIGPDPFAATTAEPAPSTVEDPNNPLPPGHRPNADAYRSGYAGTLSRNRKGQNPPSGTVESYRPVQQPLYPVAHYSRF
jgi:hypothetical protein